MSTQAKRLSNLLLRGRRLHWQNAQQIAAERFRLRLPIATPPRVELVYRTLQLVSAIRFIQARRYLQGVALDGFLSSLYDAVAQKESARIEKMMEVYAACFDDEERLADVVGVDLCHAILGKSHDELVLAFRKSPRSIHRTTSLYCAETFRDAEMLRKLS